MRPFPLAFGLPLALSLVLLTTGADGCNIFEEATGGLVFACDSASEAHDKEHACNVTHLSCRERAREDCERASDRAGCEAARIATCDAQHARCLRRVRTCGPGKRCVDGHCRE